MKIDYRELQDETRFRKIMEVGYNDVVWFIMKHIKPDNPAMRWFYGFNISLVLGFAWTIFCDIQMAKIGFLPAAGCFLTGFVAFFLLIPAHEGLHVLAFKMLGAPNVSVSAQWDKFAFFAIADRFVMNYREFLFLALLPFVLINAGLIVAILYVSPAVQMLLWSVLFSHSTGCIGDFSLIGFLSQHDPRTVLNYDDKELGITCFFNAL